MNKALVALAVVGVAAFGSTLTLAIISLQNQQPDATPAIQAQQPVNKHDLLKLVNEERAKVGVPPLVIDERLNQSAQRKADDMEKNDYFDHVSPVDGRHGYELANDTGIECKRVSENIRYNGYGKNTAKDAVIGWYESEPHRKAMLDPKYTNTGFGIAGSRIAQHFCEP